MKTAELVPNFIEVREGQTWVGGPTHVLQKQHIPGYQGTVRSLESENVHGKTFARVTAECLNKRQFTGFEYTPNERYKTNYQQEFKGPNLRNAPLTDAAETILKQHEFSQSMYQTQVIENYQKAPKTINDIPPIDRVPIIGYQGFRPVYRPPLKKVEAPQEPVFQQTQFDQLAYEQKKQIIESELEKNNRMGPIKPPVVGYTGFQKAIYAENMYGKTFNDQAKNSLAKEFRRQY